MLAYLLRIHSIYNIDNLHIFTVLTPSERPQILLKTPHPTEHRSPIGRNQRITTREKKLLGPPAQIDRPEVLKIRNIGG